MTLRVAFDPSQLNHAPASYLVNGVPQPNPETPERMLALLDGVARLGVRPEPPAVLEHSVLERVHDQAYLEFLSGAWERWSRLVPRSDLVTPNVHALGRPSLPTATCPQSVAGQVGYYLGDGSSPLTSTTWASSLASAATAAQAAVWTLTDGAASYALCRPPGHHAARDVAAGFCYLNNAAVAAELGRSAGQRVAILDIDVHHGNGTAAIYYDDPDVLVVSIHADPTRFYPFFWGYAHETGRAAGLGATMNLPLPRGVERADYLVALGRAVERIKTHETTFLVLSAGLDIHRDDPLRGFALSTSDIGVIAREIAYLKLPTVVVQEGGYAIDLLADNIAALLEGTAR